MRALSLCVQCQRPSTIWSLPLFVGALCYAFPLTFALRFVLCLCFRVMDISVYGACKHLVCLWKFLSYLGSLKKKVARTNTVQTEIQTNQIHVTPHELHCSCQVISVRQRLKGIYLCCFVFGLLGLFVSCLTDVHCYFWVSCK